MKRLSLLALLLAAAAVDAQDKPAVPAPASLTLQAAGTEDQDLGKAATLIGPESRLQVVVSATLPDGRLVDWTGAAKYTTAPEGIVAVDETGLVTPLKEGTAAVTASAGAATCSVPVSVVHYNDPPLINFPNLVTPIFTKLGCNSGGCHGKSGGQNGFRL
ncbi:MAG TPA: S-layer protein, partial [Planctomycetota bacterium]|nr:S-layer protein [Planctomycetota bacterium]